MFETLKNAFSTKDIRNKIFYTLIMMFIYRLGCYIPIPGLDSTAVTASFNNDNLFMSILSSVTGGALSNGTIFALGIVPFINSFIIMQLVTMIIPALERMSKEGEEGKKKITQITRVVAIGLAIVQGIGIVMSWKNSNAVTSDQNGGFLPEWLVMVFIVLILTGGSSLVMWIGERVTEYGVGNGTSLIIFVGILSTAATAVINSVDMAIKNQNIGNIWLILLFLLLLVAIFFCIVFVDSAERKIMVQYAKQVKGNKMYGGQSTHIPIKVNASGVMPIIFASAFLMFPQMITSLFWQNSAFDLWWRQYMGVGTWTYSIVITALIFGFSYFYSSIQFDPDDVAKNIQQYGGFLPGIRPGKPTSDHLRRINNRITLFGAIFLSLINLIPSIIFKYLGQGMALSNAFTATGLLIVVSVALEFNKQLENQLMMRNYKGFLK